MSTPLTEKDLTSRAREILRYWRDYCPGAVAEKEKRGALLADAAEADRKIDETAAVLIRSGWDAADARIEAGKRHAYFEPEEGTEVS